MDRRRFVFSTGSGLFLILDSNSYAGFFDHTPDSCQGSTDLDVVLCRQDLFLNSAPSYVTAGMLIGAALGAGIAVAARFHPGAAVLASLGGALLGGGATAADLYINYRMKEANGDLGEAKSGVRRDISHDSNFSSVSVVDAMTLYKAMKVAVADANHRLIQNADTFAKAQLGHAKMVRVCKQIRGSNDVYQHATKILDMQREPKPAIEIKESSRNLATLDEIQSISTIQEMING